MTKLMRDAIARIERLPELRQDELAQALLRDLEEEAPRRVSPELAEIIAEARREVAEGRTRPMDELFD